MKPWMGLVALALVAVGCGDEEQSEVEVACEDLADTLATRAQQCGSSYRANYDAFVNGVGGCDSFVSLRDSAEFYDECLPAYMAYSCADLNNASLPAPSSCNMQLQR